MAAIWSTERRKLAVFLIFGGGDGHIWCDTLGSASLVPFGCALRPPGLRLPSLGPSRGRARGHYAHDRPPFLRADLPEQGPGGRVGRSPACAHEIAVWRRLVRNRTETLVNHQK